MYNESDTRQETIDWVRSVLSLDDTPDELILESVHKSGINVRPHLFRNGIFTPVSVVPVHLINPKTKNNRKAVCSLDYQHLNRYSKVPSRVTCNGCCAYLVYEQAVAMWLTPAMPGMTPSSQKGTPNHL